MLAVILTVLTMKLKIPPREAVLPSEAVHRIIIIKSDYNNSSFTFLSLKTPKERGRSVSRQGGS